MVIRFMTMSNFLLSELPHSSAISSTEAFTDGLRQPYCFLPEVFLSCLDNSNRTLVVHPARKQTISRAEFPHGFVVVLDGRQPACVLRLAMRKFRSDLWSAF